LAPPPSDRQGHRARSLGSELQTPRCRHGKPDDLADDGPETTKGKRLFHVRQHIFLFVGLHEDHPICFQSDLRQRRKEQVRPRQAPDDWSFCAGRDPRRKERRRGSIDGSCSASREFMECAVGQSAPRKNRIYFRHPEFQASDLLHRTALDRADAFSKIGYDVRADSGHRSRILSKSR
jgi:hypothetical protein